MVPLARCAPALEYNKDGDSQLTTTALEQSQFLLQFLDFLLQPLFTVPIHSMKSNPCP